MNFEDVLKYWNYIEILSLLVGLLLIGGAFALPSLSKIADGIIDDYLGHLALLFVIAFALILLSIFTGHSNLFGLNIDPVDFLVLTLTSIFAFCLFIVISMGISGALTGKLNSVLIIGITLTLNYVFQHYLKTAILNAP